MTAPAAVHERGVPFTTVSVREILAGRKTQTRRVVTLDPWMKRVGMSLEDVLSADPGLGGGAYLKLRRHADDTIHRLRCPYGEIGDRLWVREAFAVLDMRLDCLDLDRAPRPSSDCPVSVTYCADDTSRETFCSPDEWRPSFDNDHVSWRRPRFMPRWASRITLEITDVRAECLQDISEDDAEDEGFSGEYVPHLDGEREWSGTRIRARDQFAAAWDDVNAKRGYPWSANPWVWVIAFRRVAP